MIEAIYKGATRPPMKWGVPLLALVGVLMPLAVVTMWIGSLVTPWAFAVGFALGGGAFGWMRYVTTKDDQRLAQWMHSIKLHLANRNRALFGLRSYGAYRADGARSTWRR